VKGLKLAGYTSWFFLMFWVGVYLTFPLDDLKPQIVSAMEDALGKGKQGTYGVDPKVTLGSLSLSGFGVAAEHVQVQLASKDPEPGPTIDVDELSIGVRPWSLLGKARTVVLDADLYDGTISGTVSLDEKGQLFDADVDVDDVDLAKCTPLLAVLGVPATGKIEASVELDLGATPEKDGEGNVKLAVKGLTLGPGSPKAAAAFGGFTLPVIDLGNLTGEMPIVQGKGTLQGMKLDGKDVQLELGGDISVKSRFGMSRLDLDGWFFPTPALFEKDPKLKTAIELGESLGASSGLSKSKDEEGHYHFTVKGTVSNPNAQLARDGKKAKSKPAAKPPKAPKEKDAEPTPSAEADE
jgi:type II secretion system protein N